MLGFTRHRSWFYHKILLEWWPRVHDWHGGHSVQGFERNDLSGELWKATVNSALQNEKQNHIVITTFWRNNRTYSRYNNDPYTTHPMRPRTRIAAIPYKTLRDNMSKNYKRDIANHVRTSLVPRKELTGVIIWTGCIRLSFHSWFNMSVRSKIFCLFELNMLCTTKNTSVLGWSCSQVLWHVMSSCVVH